MGDMTPSASRTTVVRAALALAALALAAIAALTVFGVLVQPVTLLASAAATGFSLGLLVAPRVGVFLRVVALITGAYTASVVLEQARDVTGAGRPYVLALAAIVLAVVAFFARRLATPRPLRMAGTTQ
jgi:hypothetical protein